MNPHYNQKYTKEQIKVILDIIHNCVRTGNYKIEQNAKRQENIDFINDYNINENKRANILLKIEVNDFCHSLQNINVGYEHETLYVFSPQVELFYFDDIEPKPVDMYVKFNIIELPNKKFVSTVSFHKLNEPIDHCFK